MIRLFFLAILLAGGTALAGACERTLVEATRYTMPAWAEALAALDAQGDGRIDLIATRTDAPSLLLYTSTVDGLSAPTDVPLGFAASALYAEDAGGDGKNELIAAGTNRIATLFPNGDGTFRVVTTNITGTPLMRMVRVADMTGDGKLDVVAILAAPGGTAVRGVATIFAGSGDGSFVKTASLDLTATVRNIGVGEVTGDAMADLLIVDVGKSFILPGAAGGTFGTARTLTSTGNEGSATAADFDGDGRNDILVAGSSASTRKLFLSSRNYENPIDHNVTGVALARDFDGDGKVDLMGGTQTYRGNGDGTFTPVWRAAHGAYALVMADFNADGIVDLVVSDLPDTLFVHDGVDGLRFDGARAYRGLPSPSQVSVVDLNGDQRADVLTASNFGFVVFLSDANGVLTATTYPNSVTGATSAVAADFTGDGHVDVFTLYGLVPGDGAGKFDRTANIAPPSELRGFFNGLAGDFNGDGKKDIVALEAVSPRPTSILLLTGSGSGQFTLSHVPVVHGAIDVVVADFNGDSISDVVTVGRVANNSETQTLRVMTGRRQGGFDPSVEIGSGMYAIDWAASLDTRDVDGDGHADVAVPSVSRRAVLLFHGNGNGTFRAPNAIPIEGPDDVRDGLGVALGDFTGDGRTDIVVTNDGVFETSLHAQQSNGTFRRVARFVDSDDRGAAAGDLNGDGASDLVVAADPLGVYLSTCRDALPAKPPIVRLIVTPSLLIATLDEREARGDLTFYDGDTKLGTVAVENGMAKLATTLPAGTHRITAVYSGAAAFARGVSDTITFDGSTARRRAIRH